MDPLVPAPPRPRDPNGTNRAPGAVPPRDVDVDVVRERPEVQRRGGRGPALVALALASLLVGGCTQKQSTPRYPNTNVGGRIFLDRVPIREGMIAFASLDPKNGAVVVTRITRGRYIAERVPLGKVRVFISSVKNAGPKTPSINIIPPKYQIGIDREVSRKTSRIDFRLDSEEPTVKSEPGPEPGSGPDPDTATVGDGDGSGAGPVPGGDEAGLDPVPPGAEPAAVPDWG